MRRKALVGFTRLDFLAWLADECRDRGCAMEVRADQRVVIVGGDAVFVRCERADPMDFDEIIERGELAA